MEEYLIVEIDCASLQVSGGGKCGLEPFRVYFETLFEVPFIPLGAPLEFILGEFAPSKFLCQDAGSCAFNAVLNSR